MFHTFTQTILNLLFPPKCPFCGRVLEVPGICPACQKALPWAEGEQSLRTLPGGFICAAPLRYEELARDGILRFKFRGRSAAAGPLGELIAQCAAEHFPGKFNVVTWVPVSRKRLRQRGYDQAELLARSACRLWGVKPQRLLEKISDNPAQSGLENAAARRVNVQDVYRASNATGKRVLVIDDICTTGSTLAECAQTLRRAGAEDVVCAAAALTPREKVNNSVKEWGCNRNFLSL